MTIQEQLNILQQGVKVWNAWKPKHHFHERIDLSGADLSGANLRGANLAGVFRPDPNLSKVGQTLHRLDLSGANLAGANLREADLAGADLSHSNLSGANLREANLSGADLNHADLSGTDLTYAEIIDTDLISTDLSNATIGGTVFGELDLSRVKGLETIQHRGPSHLSINTLYKSGGDIPEAFVQGTGAPNSFIEYMHALAYKPIQYYACFISYSSQNQEFAERLYADLQHKGVRCWYAPEDLKIGDHFPQRIEEAIRLYDKLIVILSEHSMKSSWVEDEVRAAQEKEERFKKEQQINKTVLFPITIDQAIERTTTQWAAGLRRQRHIGKFINWKEHDHYQEAFQRLIRDLQQAPTKDEQQQGKIP